MTRLVSERTTDRYSGSQSEMVRHWSSLQVILVITDVQDEESLKFHALLQAAVKGISSGTERSA